MKNIFFTFLAFFSIQILLGQNTKSPEVLSSNTYTGKKFFRDIFFDSVKDNDGNIYSLNYNDITKTKVTIRKFDSKLRLKKETTIKTGKNLIIYSGLIEDNKLHLFGCEPNEASGKVYEIDYLKKEIIEKKNVFNATDEDLRKKAKTVQFGGFIAGIGMAVKEQYRDIDVNGYFKSSKNDNFHLYSRDIKSEDNKYDAHLIRIVDKNFNLVFEKLYVIEEQDKLIEIEDVAIDDSNGDVYLIIKRELDKQSRKRKKNNIGSKFQTEVHKITKDESKIIIVDSSEDYLKEFIININQEGLLLAALTTKSKLNRNEGIFIGSYDKNLNEKLKIKNKLSVEVLRNVTTSEASDKDIIKNRDDGRLNFKPVIITNHKEEITLGLEDYDTYAKTSETATSTGYDSRVLIIKFDSDGKVTNSTGFFKYRSGLCADAFGSSALYFNDSFYFIFDSKEIKTTEKDNILYFKGHPRKGNAIHYVKIDLDTLEQQYGKLNKEGLIIHNNRGYFNVSENEIVIEGSDRLKKHRLSLIKF